MPGSSKRGRLAWVLLASTALFGSCAACGVGRQLVRLFGPPSARLTEVYEERPDGPVFDHAILDGLLARHVDADGWVDYDGLLTETRSLESYLEALGAAPFEQLGRSEKLALLINAYNAFTLALILENYPISGIREIPAARRWEAVRWNVGGRRWSLDQIEHEQIRDRFREPRVHFALVCAAVGCPPLRPEAYVAARLDSQLEQQTTYVHRHAAWFELDAAAPRLRLTRLYLWYEGDFETVAGSVPAFAARYSPELRGLLDRGETPTIEWLDYDWKLNATQNKRPR